MRTFFIPEMHFFAWAPCCFWRDVAYRYVPLARYGGICDIKSPDKSQGNAIIRSIIADYFVPKILSPASPRPGTM